jgi:hypothetical protein
MFLANGRIMDCILCLEAAIMAQQAIPQSPCPPTGHPLCHHFSQPPAPLTPPLVRTASQHTCDSLHPVPSPFNQ